MGLLDDLAAILSGGQASPSLPGDRLFQHRLTGIPGRIGATTASFRAGEWYPPGTPLPKGVDWGKRPEGEGFMGIAPDYATDPDSFTHEAAHSLFSQSGIKPDDALIHRSKELPLGSFSATHPSLIPSETAAYAAEGFGGPEATAAYFQHLKSLTKSPREAAAIEKLMQIWQYSQKNRKKLGAKWSAEDSRALP